MVGYKCFSQHALNHFGDDITNGMLTQATQGPCRRNQLKFQLINLLNL